MNDAREEAARVRALDSAVNAARIALAGAAESAAGFPWAVALAVAATLLLWASAFVGIRYAVREYDAGGLALLRNTITAGFMLVLAMASQRSALKPPRLRDLGLLLAAGAIGIALYQLALISGERSVDAGTASLIINTSPIITALFALLALGEHPGGRGWAGLLLGFAGAALLISGVHGAAAVGGGAWFVLLASAAQAASIVIQKPLLARFGPIMVTLWVALFGALCLLPYGPAMLHDLKHAGTTATLAVVYLGVFSAGIGNLAWAYALSRLPAGRAAAALYLVAPIAMTISWFTLDERPTLQALVGGAVVIASLVLVNTRSRASR
ncbi:MAG TPA: EamA family transporter [Gammaproteobacteria bacterium]|nr:EamA family transporter [Gammaproteobacteria bacterium]